jgi:hypothetical protein
MPVPGKDSFTVNLIPNLIHTYRTSTPADYQILRRKILLTPPFMASEFVEGLLVCLMDPLPKWGRDTSPDPLYQGMVGGFG